MDRLQDVIEARILNERKIFLWGQVDDNSARYVVERLLYLDSLRSGEEIKLFINSPGGMVTSGSSIHDTMKAIESPVSTICTGLAASMGAILLSAGEKGRRFVQPLGRIMIHQPSGGIHGPSADIEIQIDQIKKIKLRSAKLLAANCGQTVETILQDFDRDHWMNAEEAVKYGIVDGILE